MPEPDRSDRLSVLVVGSMMMDQITYVEELPRAGETVVGISSSLGFGGKGANQAVMCALLGAGVRFVGSIGKDVFGEMTLANLASFGIDTADVSSTGAQPTGVAAIWVDGRGENRIIVVPGANTLLSPARVEESIRRAPPAVLICQLESPPDAVELALLTARELGRVGILNPAPSTDVSPDLLAACSWLIPNETELAAIATRLNLDPERPTAELAALVASELNVELIVTLGLAGAILCRRGGEISSIPTRAANVVDTTGAGDVFVGAFAYAIALGVPAPEAVSFGCRCATASVERPGTQTSFPREQKLAELKAPLRDFEAAR